MELPNVVDIIVNVLLLPLQFLLIPIDFVLSNIPNISSIPTAINSVLSIIGSIPSTLVNIFGINPFIWNAIFLTFVLYIGLAPSINVIKKIWAWIRP